MKHLEHIGPAITLDILATSERVIRDLAATVVNHATARRDHPSYGYTLTGIRAIGHQMDGAIGLYMVLTGQANHAQVAGLATFTDPATTQTVAQARNELENLR
jgi:hypothetical protein